MVYFLYGPDTYRSRKKLNEIISRYKKIHKSGLNFSRLDLEKSDFLDFKNRAETVSIFSEKKLVVLEEVFSNKKFQKEFLDWVKKENSDKDKDRIIVIFEAGTSGLKDQDFLKELKKISKNQEFKLLGELQLKNWVLNWLKERKTLIGNEALKKLIFGIGPDLWQMNNELKKLIAYRKSYAVSKKHPLKILAEDVDLLVKPKIESNIFEAIDALSLKNKRRALMLFHRLLAKGENELYILTMIIYAFRNLIKVKSELEKKTPFRVLSSKLGLHPYVVKKTLRSSQYFSFSELKKIYQKLLEIDIDIKRGKVDPRVALDMLILGL